MRILSKNNNIKIKSYFLELVLHNQQNIEMLVE